MENNIQRSLGRIEGKIDGINQRLDKMNGTLKSHDEKIDDLEGFVNEIKGQEKQITKIASIGGAIAGGFITAVYWIFSKIFGS